MWKFSGTEREVGGEAAGSSVCGAIWALEKAPPASSDSPLLGWAGRRVSASAFAVVGAFWSSSWGLSTVIEGVARTLPNPAFPCQNLQPFHLFAIVHSEYTLSRFAFPLFYFMYLALETNFGLLWTFKPLFLCSL